MAKVSEMLGITPDWRPGKYDIIRLYYTAQQNRWTKKGVHALMEAQFKKSTSKDLTYSEYEQLVGWIEKLEPDTVTVGRDPNTLDMFDGNVPPVR